MMIHITSAVTTCVLGEMKVVLILLLSAILLGERLFESVCVPSVLLRVLEAKGVGTARMHVAFAGLTAWPTKPP